MIENVGKGVNVGGRSEGVGQGVLVEYNTLVSSGFIGVKLGSRPVVLFIGLLFAT